MESTERDEEIASHASEILGEQITPSDLQQMLANDEVRMQNIEYRLELIEQALGIENGYIYPGSIIKTKINAIRRRINGN